MTRSEKVAKAQRLAAEGASHGEIGRRLGVTRGCVFKWLHPDRARAYARKQEARPERKVAKAAWTRRAHREERYRSRCSQCGGPTGSFVWKKSRPERCQSCISAGVESRSRQIEQWWTAGLLQKEIAERLGWSVGAVSVGLVEMRKKGYDVPPRPPGGLDPVWARGPRLLIDVDRAAALYAEGRSLQQVGVVLSCSPDTVRRRLLGAGVELRPSGPRKVAA